MFRISVTAALLVSLVATACSSEQTIATRPSIETSSSSTTTTTRPTTTTTVPFTIEGADPDLTAVVEAFYSYAAGDGPPPLAPEAVTSQIVSPSADFPTSGVAATGAFAEQQTAVVEVGVDTFLAVADGGGWKIVGGEWPSLSIPSYYGGGPRLIAVIGSDARTGQPIDKTRADSIHFVTLDGAGAGAVLGLPRDSYVPVPGYGRRKITESLAVGGPELLMTSLRDLSGLPLEGYLLTGFAGFQSLVDGVLGGIEVEVPFAINDVKAKAALAAGLQLLNGFDALAFARARKTVPGGDFTRSAHQGDLLVGAARTVQAMGPLSLPKLIEAAEPSLMTDLTAEAILTFAMMTLETDLSTVPNQVAPGSAGRAGSASVVYLADSASAIFADIADGRLDG